MILPIVIVVALVTLIFAIGSSREKKAKQAKIDNVIKNYGRDNNRKYSYDELKAVKAYLEHGNMCSIDDITWNDLDMDLIYKKINYCHSSAGDEYMYYILHNPKTEDYDWTDFEDKVNGISKDESLRKKLITAFYNMGRTGKYSIFTYLDFLDGLKLWPVFSDLILDLLYIPAIVFCFFEPLYGVITVFIIVAISLETYFKKKRKIEPYIICFQYIYRILENSESLKTIESEILKNELTDLVNHEKNLSSFRRFSSIVIGDLGSSPLGVLLDYFKMITHVDLIKFRSMSECIRNNKQSIIDMLLIIGRIDCYLAIGEFRNNLGTYCVPELSENYKGLLVKDGVHPLISKPVANSVDISKSILLTGSNASGKSTFLKMLAVNCLLAQSVHTCSAKEYKAPYYRLFSSLSPKDNIVEGDSYYMAEIKALKRIIDASNQSDTPVIGFVDEILKGTNTIERISASSAIITNLINKNVLCIAATHDIELTSILKECDNYHFEEIMSDDDIKFSYELLPGKASSRNAIKLLDIMGYGKDIIKAAYERVDSFEEKGIWE